MKVARQLSVMMPNEPGQLAGLCKKLAAKKVNICAISVVDTAEQGIARMVVDKSAVAQKVVRDLKYGLVVTDVIVVEMTNKPGTLAKASDKLAKAKINIQYVYGSTGLGAQPHLCPQILGRCDTGAVFRQNEMNFGRPANKTGFWSDVRLYHVE